ncbi:MAG TPA: hypothetical protein VMF29_03820, partial [Candidatus Edwardsbacteria bacterium]|nr:hypothetical protein [Candidatus Edwardsbacteria bacterium]
NEEYRVIRGMMLSRRRQHDSAAAEFQRAIALDPRDDEPYGMLAANYAEDHEMGEAMRLADRAVRLARDRSKALNTRGILYGQYLDSCGRALEDFDAAIRLDTLYVSAYYNRCYCYEELLDYAHAEADARTLFRLTRGSAYGRQRLASVLLNHGWDRYLAGDYRGALEQCRQAIETDSMDLSAYHNAVQACYRLEDSAGIMAYGARAMAIEGDKQRSGEYVSASERSGQHLIAGVLAVTERRYDSALKEYTAAIVADSLIGDPFDLRGDLYHLLGNDAAAVADWRCANRLDSLLPVAAEARTLSGIQPHAK